MADKEGLQTTSLSRYVPGGGGFGCSRKRTARRRPLSLGGLESIHVLACLTAICCLLRLTDAAWVKFDNCLPSVITRSDPRVLQFTPLQFWATFDTVDVNHSLNLTVYGNVSGRATNEPYPPPDDPRWSNPNETLGKIANENTLSNRLTTLFGELGVLTYTPYNIPPTRFCQMVVNAECPISPAFFTAPNDTDRLPGFTFSHDMVSRYSFATITPTFHVKSGDDVGSVLACVSANITPALGRTIEDLLRYLPLVVLIAVAVATVAAGLFSPWGSTDIFRWSSNYGRDEDLLRLVTPGFADCLGYIQFIFLSGSLSLSYPGYYQSVVSQVSWSSLMFSQSFVTRGNGRPSITDGIYTVDGAYGLDRASQYVGITSPNDIWAGMMVWLLVIIVAVTGIVQFGFAVRWTFRRVSNAQAEDHLSKNVPFTLGNVVRIVFNYFLLPIMSFSAFQLVIAGQGPAYVVALAALTIILVVLFQVWMILLFSRTPRRGYLFDDVPTVLLYGPLYNTYSDDAAIFALVPMFINIVRGIAIGAVQASGVAQVILLAASEIILALTLNAFRPFPAPTSMNIWQTIFAVIRFMTIVLSIAFVPSLGLTEAPKGWIGYVILLMHAAVLALGFFLNALSTLVEVGARLAGAGGDATSGRPAARGGLTKVFGLRQLTQRPPPRDHVVRRSMASDAAMLAQEPDQKSIQLEAGHVRSLSASSAQLLRSERADTAHEAGSAGVRHSRGSGSGQFTPTTPITANMQNIGPAPRNRPGSMSPGGIVGIKQAEAADPYYRPPRPRRNTTDLMLEPTSPAERSRGSWASGDWRKSPRIGPDNDTNFEDIGEGPSTAKNASKTQMDDFVDEGQTHTNTDYAVREVDFYYGVRGPALSRGTVRKLKTGPADPTGPVSSATGWLRGLLTGKTKEKGKGFEVVRSSRAPPSGLMPSFDGTPDAEPYQDEPEHSAADGSIGRAITRYESAADSEEDYAETYSNNVSDTESQSRDRISQLPPSLPAIDAGGNIELPSRIGSRASQASRSGSNRKPPVPRKSSKRGSSADFSKSGIPAARLSTVPASPPASPRAPPPSDNLTNPNQHQPWLRTSSPQRLPFSPMINTSPAKTQTSLAETAAGSSLLHLAEEESTGISPAKPSRTSSSALGKLAPDIREDRPSSMGYVAQHRAGESIHEASPDSPHFKESRAEFVDNTSLPRAR